MKSISCKDAVDYILKKEEGKLSPWQRIKLWQHLAICSLCRIFSWQNNEINNAMHQRKSGQRGLSSSEKENIIRNVLDKKE